MTLVLRKCWANGYSSYNFFYGNTGERVNCPDWNSEPICGNGLHGLKEGNGCWGLLSGTDWLIIDADDQIVDIDEHKCKFNTGIIKFRGTTEELANSEFPSLLQLDGRSAYNWARIIGNHDIMINKIDNSEYAYLWADYIGNHDIMISKITDMKYAYLWGKYIGNQDIMIDKINDPEWAYFWARNIGNQDIMKPKVTDPYYINLWNVDFPNNQIPV